VVAMRSTVPPGEQGPIRALVGPVLILLVGVAGIGAYLTLWPEPPPVTTPDVAEAAPAAAPTAPVATAPSVPATPEVESAMEDVRVSCPLAPGVAPRPLAISSSWYDGGTGFGQAEREQSLVKAPMFVYLFTDWCPYCKGFEREVLGNGDVDRYLRARVIKARVNPEQGPSEAAVEARLRSRGYPSLYLILPGVTPMEVWTSIGEDRRYDPPRFIQGLETAIQSRVDNLVQDGVGRRRAGDPAGAVESLDGAIALKADAVAAYYQRGLAHEERGDDSRALDDFATVLALEPRPELYGHVGESLGRGGRHDEAVACWTQQIQQQPDNARALLGRSRSHQARGDRARARADADEACRRGEPQGCRLAKAL